MLSSLKRSLKFNLKIPSDDIAEICKPSVIGCYLSAKIRQIHYTENLHPRGRNTFGQHPTSRPPGEIGGSVTAERQGAIATTICVEFPSHYELFRTNYFRSSLSGKRSIVNRGRITFAWVNTSFLLSLSLCVLFDPNISYRNKQGCI